MYPKLRILHVEDSDIQIEMVKLLFSDCLLTNVKGEAQAKELLRSQTFDVVLLDISLEEGSGLNVCTYIKNDARLKQTPVLLLSEKSEVSDRILGLDLGADDYLPKPFHLLELKARVVALIRRNNQSSELETSLRIENLELRTDTHEFVAYLPDGSTNKTELSKTEFKLLFYLMKHVDHILTRAQIMDNVWGQDIHITDRSVDAKISILKKKLAHLPQLIESLYGIGYRLNRPTAVGNQQETKLAA